MSASEIDSLVLELATDGAISKSAGWIQRKSKLTNRNNHLAQTGHFRKTSPAEKRIAWIQRGKGNTVSTSQMARIQNMFDDIDKSMPIWYYLLKIKFVKKKYYYTEIKS